jgi:hypothetical protein
VEVAESLRVCGEGGVEELKIRGVGGPVVLLGGLHRASEPKRIEWNNIMLVQFIASSLVFIKARSLRSLTGWKFLAMEIVVWEWRPERSLYITFSS